MVSQSASQQDGMRYSTVLYESDLGLRLRNDGFQKEKIRNGEENESQAEMS